MISIRYSRLAVLALAVAASQAAAQARPAARTAAQRAAIEDYWELGTDASASLGFGDQKSFSIDIPTGVLRAGYFVTPKLSLEPQLIFHSLAAEDQEGQSVWALQIGGLYHLSTDRTRRQYFIHPGIAFTGGSAGAPEFTILSALVGAKQPWFGGRLAMRGEVGLVHQLEEAPFEAQTSIVFNFGWSVYTR
jgi:hypothetical protein